MRASAPRSCPTVRAVVTNEALICLRRRPGLRDLREGEVARGVAVEPAADEVEARLRVVVGLVLRQRAALDLVVDDCGGDAIRFVRAQSLEVQVALDGPFDGGRDRELEPALDGDGFADARNELGEGEVDRVQADLERGPFVEVLLPGDAALVAFGSQVADPAVAVGVAHLLDAEALAVLEDVPVVEAERAVDAVAERSPDGANRSPSR